MKISDDDPREVDSMGYLAQYVLDKRLPLEICLTSNVDTGAVKSIKEHPFGIYYRYKFRVMLNTDNRLMSKTSMTKEYKLAQDAFNLTFHDFEKLSINAMKSAFIPYKKRIDLIYNVIKPGFKKAKRKLESK
jgi:adenosine deaminase